MVSLKQFPGIETEKLTKIVGLQLNISNTRADEKITNDMGEEAQNSLVILGRASERWIYPKIKKIRTNLMIQPIFYYRNRNEKITTTRFIQLTKRNIKMHLSRQETPMQLHHITFFLIKNMLLYMVQNLWATMDHPKVSLKVTFHINSYCSISSAHLRKNPIA